jgi:signal transduction histidine kinase
MTEVEQEAVGNPRRAILAGLRVGLGRLWGLFGGISLTGRLLILVVLLASFVEIVFFVPTLARYRDQWLSERLNAALIASLALDAAPDHRIPDALGMELLSRAGVLAVSRKDANRRAMVLRADLPAPPELYYDLDIHGLPGFMNSVAGAAGTLLKGDGRIIRVSGTPDMRRPGADASYPVIDIVVAERPLRDAMIGYFRRVIWGSLVISGLTAFLAFASFNRILVHPIRRLVESMLRFREAPEDARRVIQPTGRSDEIGEAEQALAAMQRELRSALNQKTRLAALGGAVSKINHDLRNMLASAQLFSDRMAESSDPVVQSQAPKLMRALDRAIELTSNTLRYGRADEPAPRPQRFFLADLVDEVQGALPNSAARFENRTPRDLTIEADPDQVYRMVLNLARNALEALESEGRDGAVIIAGVRDPGGTVAIEVIDDGPGIPVPLKAHLFEPFASGRRVGGTGLGLAISRELARAHGGDLLLVRSDPEGTVFRITLPDRAHFH